MTLIDEQEYKQIGKITEVRFETSPYSSQSLSFTADVFNPADVKKILEGETRFENAFSIVPDDFNFLFGSYNPAIKKVIFSPPATIVLWKDGTKTVVKCKEGDQFDKWAGLSLCISKKIFGKKFHRVFKEWCDKEDKND